MAYSHLSTFLDAFLFLGAAGAEEFADLEMWWFDECGSPMFLNSYGPTCNHVACFFSLSIAVKSHVACILLVRAKRREFSGMIHWLTINNHPIPPATHPFPSIPHVKRTSKLLNPS